MRKIGLHIRFSDCFSQVINKAQALEIPHFQSFFLDPNERYIKVSPLLIQHYEQARAHFNALYVHSSYYVNLADQTMVEHYYLAKELKHAQKLGFTHIVAHPGAQINGASREQALDTIAQNINIFLKRYAGITFVLENSAHGKKSIGGNFQELRYIKERIDQPERVVFCIDTAHAHVFGYDIIERTNEWVDEVCKILGGESIGLIHLNDTNGLLGSFNDHHCMIGEGQLGVEILKTISQHPLLSQVPIILELPVADLEAEIKALELVRSW